jgi:putative oxidoreductase
VKPAAIPSDLLRWAVPAGRALFASIFIFFAFGHFSPTMTGYAASAGVPLASIAVPFSGVLALVGGVSILLGYRTRIGAALIVLFLVPVTFMMHKFWAVPDPMMAQMQMIMFMKNIALTGASLLLVYYGGGPISLDARRGR